MTILSQIGLKLTAEGGEQVNRELALVSRGTKETAKSSDVLGDALSRVRGLFIGFSVAATVREFFQAADAMTAVNARLKLATTSTQEYAQAQADVYRISQGQSASLRETADLYARLADPIRKLGGSSKEVAGITEALAASLRISGTTGAAAAGAITQFAQAMASGALRGDEFNSVNEAAPRLMQALEAALGKTRGQLRGMAEDGKLTADVVGNALLSELGRLKAESATLPDTVGTAFQRLQNDLGMFASQVDTAAGASSSLASVLVGVSGLVNQLGVSFSSAGTSTRAAASDLDLAALAITAVGRVLETVTVLGANVAFVLKGVGLELGGLAAQAAALVRGDFAQVGEIHRQMQADADANRKAIDAFSTSVLGSTERVLQQRDALRAGTVSASENTAEMAKLARQSGITADAKLKQAQATKTEAELEKEAAKAKRDSAKAEKDRADAAVSAAALRNQIAEDAIAADEKSRQATEAQIKTAREYLEKLEFETKALSMTSAERAVSTAMRELERQGIEKGTLAYDAYIEKIREAVLTKDQVQTTVDNAKKQADDLEKLNDQIGQSLANALMDGGKSAWEYIKGLFRSQVLSPVIQAVLAPVTGAATNIIGGLTGALTGGGGGLGGAISSIGGLSSLASATGVFGAGLSAGLGGLLGGFSGIGAALSGSASLIGGGSLAAGLGLGVGVLGPLALLAGPVLSSLFGRKLKDFGIEGELSTEGIDGNNFRFFKGGLFSSNKTKRTDLDPAVDAAFDSGLTAASATVRAYADILGLPVQAIAGYSEQIKISFKGLSEDEIREKIAQTITSFQDNLATVYSKALEQYARAGESANQTLQRLAQLEVFAQNINSFGGVFSRIATLGIDARESLIALAGGVDALLSKTQDFVRLYYSEQEQAAIAARQVLDNLWAAAPFQVSLSGLTTTAQYRELLESQDLNAEEGRQRFNALLSNASAFAQVAQYLQANGGNIGRLAASAPADAVLDTLFNGQAATQEPLQIGFDQVTAGIAQGNSDVVTAIGRLREEVIGLRGDTGLVISNTAATTRQLSAWDDGGFLATTQGEGA